MWKILLVEDELEILEVLKRFLEKEGKRVVTASSGQEAVDKITEDDEADHIDLAVLDIKMPGMSGFDCLREIRKIKPDFKALFLTGSIDKLQHVGQIKELGCGADDVLQKPVDLYELNRKIEKKLSGRET